MSNGINLHEQDIIDNFVGTLDPQSMTLQEAIFNGEDDAKRYKLGMVARRKLGQLIRDRYYRAGHLVKS